MEEKKRGGINVGTSLVLVTFVLLLIITFATLSYVSARTDNRLTKDANARSEMYNAASNEAERIVADINEQLKNDEYFGDIDMNDNISFVVPIDDKTELAVVLHVSDFTEDTVTTVEQWLVRPLQDASGTSMFEDDEEMNLLF